VIDDNELFDKIVCVRSFLTPDILHKWNTEHLTTDKRWAHLFTHFQEQHISSTNVVKMVEFCLCLPGTNAATERVFSLMNDVWTSEKTQMTTETLADILVTKTNFAFTCIDFHGLLLKKPHLLKAIHSSKKYKGKNKTQGSLA